MPDFSKAIRRLLAHFNGGHLELHCYDCPFAKGFYYLDGSQLKFAWC